MRVRVLFFGILKDLIGRESESLDLREGATLADVLSYYEERVPKIREVLHTVALSVNQHYAGPGAVLGDDDEVGLLPPVSGGASRTTHAAIVREPIEVRAITEKIKDPADGAAVVFDESCATTRAVVRRCISITKPTKRWRW